MLFRIYPDLQKQPGIHTAGQILILSLQVAGQADPQTLNSSFGPVHFTAGNFKMFEEISDLIIKNIKLKIISKNKNFFIFLPPPPQKIFFN